jgi:peroxiredoxin (alkyl hydroperoxide reductase subunit C)
VIVPPPKTAEEAEQRMHEGYDCKDWFFCKRQLEAGAGRVAEPVGS